MKRLLHPASSVAIRLLGSAALLCSTLPASADAGGAAIRVAQAAPAPQQPIPAATPAPATPAKPDAASSDEMQRRAEDRRSYVDAGIAALHAGLLLTPAQQNLWPPVETALRDFAATRPLHRPHEGGRAEGYASQDPVARLKERGARLAARGQAMTRLADAAGPLLAALTPEQKDRLPGLVRRILPRHMAGFGMGNNGMDRDRMGERDMGEHRMDRGRGGPGPRERFSDRDGEGRGDARRGMGERDGFRGGGGEDGGERP